MYGSSAGEFAASRLHASAKEPLCSRTLVALGLPAVNPSHWTPSRRRGNASSVHELASSRANEGSTRASSEPTPRAAATQATTSRKGCIIIARLVRVRNKGSK